MSSIAEFDAGYKGFSNFEDWNSCRVDDDRWGKYVDALDQHRSDNPEILRRALASVGRAAAVETGAIEDLYEVDRGFTFTVANELANWEALLEQKGSARRLIESQISAYDHLLDFATGQQPIVEAWLRELHKQICAGQENYRVQTSIGPQDHPLILGAYKTDPNHVKRRNGTRHSYAPVDSTASEMQRFCEVLRSAPFAAAHPVIQAAFAHYGLVAIHPFSDGNGRVARALASVFTLRAESFPLLILRAHRDEYLRALSEADRGNMQVFVDFTLERCLDSLRLAHETFRAASLNSFDESAAVVERLSRTSGGFLHTDVDAAGYRFFRAFQVEFVRRAAEINATGKAQLQVQQLNPSSHDVPDPKYREPIAEGGMALRVKLTMYGTTDAEINRDYYLEVPKDCGKLDDIVIRVMATGETFEARMSEVSPEVDESLQLRISVFVSYAISEMTAVAEKSIADGIRRRGY